MMGMSKIMSAVVIVGCFSALAESLAKPQDMKNCKLNSSSPFSWVVQIWDEQKDGGAGVASIGSLITYRAVLTTAWYFSLAGGQSNLGRYKVYGQNIWDYDNVKDGRTDPCRQERQIRQITPHPKSRNGGYLGKLLFDYSIIDLVNVFNVSTPSFPIMTFSKPALTFLLEIQQINSMQPPRCVMPIPESEFNRFLVFRLNINVKTLLFHNQCIIYICEEPLNEVVNDECSNIFWSASNGTMLCTYPESTEKFIITIKPTGDFPNYLAGIPLVCRGNTYGISTQVKRRDHLNNYKDFKRSIFFIITLLRVWRWLNEHILLYSVEPEPYVIPPTPRVQHFYDPPALSLDFNLPTQRAGGGFPAQ